MSGPRAGQPADPAQLFQEALALHQRGLLEEARKRYELILTLDPRHFDSLQLLATVHGQQGRFGEAIALFDQALRLDASSAAVHNNRANALKELQRLDEALAGYAEAIRLSPDHPDAHFNQGRILHDLTRLDEALASYTQAIRLNPNNAEAHLSRGNVLLELKRFSEALDSYGEAIRLNPNNADAHHNRGNALRHLKRLDEALTSYAYALRIRPDFPQAHLNRGNALLELKRFDEALAGYAEALRLRPDYPEAYLNRANALLGLGRTDEALAGYGEAIRLRPDFTEAFINRGNALLQLKRFDEALASYTDALRINPDHPYPVGMIARTRMELCDWTGFDDTVERLEAGILQELPVCAPFALLGLVDDPALQRQCAEIYARQMFPPTTTNAPVRQRVSGDRPRIGYYSADFHDHATLHLMMDVFAHHDHSRFDFYAFSFGPENDDPWRREARRRFTDFIDVRNASDGDVAQSSRDLGIDIAVDLKGFTGDCRPGIFSHRAAPVQINYLGYPGTMGAQYMDYLIADPVVIPSSQRAHYSEEILYLPRCYQPNMRDRVVSEQTMSRDEVGLPAEGTVFCSFNNAYKITPAMFGVWMGVLEAVAGSVLWIHVTNHTAIGNLTACARRHGIDPARLVIAPSLPVEQHLRRITLADVFLDTYPYNAHTTASDALRMGVPLITLQGRSFASRVASSILTTLGLEELITTNAGDYQRLAIELGEDHARLAALKDRLAGSIRTSALFDSRQYTRDLERIYSNLVG